MDRPAYPPEPWRLRGDMYVSLWRVPVRESPRWPLPPGARPLVLGGRCTFVTFWVSYGTGGVLAYNELLVALAVRHRRSVAGTAVAVWVDSEQSRDGGRDLWGIPKELADISFAEEGGSLRARLSDGRGATVDGDFRNGWRLPGRLPVRARLVQRRIGEAGLHEVPLRLTGTPSLGRARLAADPEGPLGFLAGRRPRLSVALRDFDSIVGPGR